MPRPAEGAKPGRRVETPPVQPPRSWLFVPGAADPYVAKLRTVSVSARPDAVVFDLEDGVATGDLRAARRRIAVITAGPAAAPWLPRTIAVRPHAVAHPHFAEDLEALGPRVTTLMLPKVDSAQEVVRAAEGLLAVGLPHVGIIAIIESATGLENATEILGSLSAAGPAGATGLQGVAFGAEDFAGDLGLPPSSVGFRGGDGAAEFGRLAVIDAARVRIVTAAVSANVGWRIDTPSLRIGQAEHAEFEARRSRAMGFSGKLAIHPDHVEPIHRGFEPDPKEVAWARAVLGSEGLSEDEAMAAEGASVVAGQMVDEAIVRQARAILAARRPAPDESGS